MFHGLARFACRRPWWIVAAWASALAASTVLAPRLPERLLAGGFDLSDSESGRSNDALERELGLSATDLTIIVKSADTRYDHPEFKGAVARVVEAVASVPEVHRVHSPDSTGDPGRVSKDGHAVFLTVSTGKDIDVAQRALRKIRPAFPEMPEGMEVSVTGIPAVYADITGISEKDLTRAEKYAFPIALLILLAVFRSPIAASLPLLLGICCITANLAVLYVVTLFRDLGIFVLNVTTAVGLGVAIDYSLLVVSRFREEIEGGKDVEAAIDRTMATAGKSIFFSGLAVVVSLVGLRFVRFVAIHSIAIGGMIVVAISVAGALTLLPALLRLLGRKIDWLVFWKNAGGEGRLWARIARLVMRRPILVFGAVLAIVLVLMSPVRHIELGVPGTDMLPAWAPSRMVIEEFNEVFPDRRIPQIVVVIEDPQGIRRPERIAEIREFVAWAKEQEHVTMALSYTNFVPPERLPTLSMMRGGAGEEAIYDWLLTSNQPDLPPALSGPVRALSSDTTTLVRITTDLPTNAEPVRELTRKIRSRQWAAGVDVNVGGESAYFMDFMAALYEDFLKAIVVVVLLTYAILVLQFGSFLLPAKAVVMNALSIGACYGAIVFIFQQGHFADILGFTPLGYIDSPIPIVIFSVLFGLSMDYEVFLLSRVKEAYDRGLSNEESVAEGLEQTGGIITSASAIMIVVAGSFFVADIFLVKTLGFGMAFAFFLDATVIRAFLVPSTMRLMGDWNWWAPRFARGFLSRVSKLTAHA